MQYIPDVFFELFRAYVALAIIESGAPHAVSSQHYMCNIGFTAQHFEIESSKNSVVLHPLTPALINPIPSSLEKTQLIMFAKLCLSLVIESPINITLQDKGLSVNEENLRSLSKNPRLLFNAFTYICCYIPDSRRFDANTLPMRSKLFSSISSFK